MFDSVSSIGVTSFAPPANLDDFTSNPIQLALWSHFVSSRFNQAIETVERIVGIGRSQFCNPLIIPTSVQFEDMDVSWNGFPKRIAAKHPGNDRAALHEADQLITDHETANTFRPQDEFLEWHVTSKNGQIVKVTFTSEVPEYWEALAHGYPSIGSHPEADFGSDRNKLVSLYRTFISPEVKLEDLFVDGRYNLANKWNTTEGAMHLSQPTNTLSAAILMAAESTVQGTQPGGLIAADANERASNSAIRAAINSFTVAGFDITLKDPIGIYMTSLNTTGWITPNGSPASRYWRILRGTEDRFIRAVYEVPESEGFTVSDIQIGGEYIQFGGQIAQHISIGLSLLMGRGHTPDNISIDTGCSPTSSSPYLIEPLPGDTSTGPMYVTCPNCTQTYVRGVKHKCPPSK